MKSYFLAEDITFDNGMVRIAVRCEGDIHVGDYYGCRKVLKLSAYGKYLDCLSSGMTGYVFLDGSPQLCVHKDDPEYIKWLEETRDKQKLNSAGSS